MDSRSASNLPFKIFPTTVIYEQQSQGDIGNNHAEGPASSRWFEGSSLEMTGPCNFARIAAVFEG